VILNADLTYNRYNSTNFKDGGSNHKIETSDDLLFELSTRVKFTDQVNLLVGRSINRKSGKFKVSDLIVPNPFVYDGRHSRLFSIELHSN
jgi:hypothetical protein